MHTTYIAAVRKLFKEYFGSLTAGTDEAKKTETIVYAVEKIIKTKINKLSKRSNEQKDFIALVYVRVYLKNYRV